MQIQKLSVTKFNDNISKFIEAAHDGEIYYLTTRRKVRAVLLGKADFDLMMGQFKELYEETSEGE